ncbi:MAG: 30S ribosomal protein S15 [Cyclobacteriaceae bacterium]|nr:30S ribosomal protein S15 [Cyclobacteriaceae bacterium]
MYLTTEKKQELFKQHGKGKSEKDTGSPESQIALFTNRINHLTSHLKNNRKDYSTQQGLLRLVGKRRKLLNYLHKIDIERYRAVLADQKLRK